MKVYIIQENFSYMAECARLIETEKEKWNNK